MSALTIPDLAPEVLARLREQAAQHGRTLEEEARTILEQALPGFSGWVGANEIRQRLLATGRAFSDCADLIREDRDR